MEDRSLAILMLTGRKVGQKPPAARPAYDWSAGRRPLAFGARTVRGVRGALGMHRSIRERRAQASAIRPGSRFTRCGRADYCSRLMASLTRMSVMLFVCSCMQESTTRARWSARDVLIRSTTICGESKAPKHAEEKAQGHGQLGGTEWRGLGGEGVRVSALLMI